MRPLPEPLPLASGALQPAAAARAPWWSLVAPPLFAAGVWVVATDVPGWNALWYLFAWYAWLLALDAAVWAWGGRSWIAQQGRALAVCAFASVPFWYLFEAYNLRLHNWYYVFVLRDDERQLLVSLLAFATVLPACFLHAELVGALGVFRRVRWRPLRVGRRLEAWLLALGVVAAMGPLLWPRGAFWLVWGAAFFLPELWCWRRGGDSLLRDLAQGRPQRLLSLLAGGMLAGLVWELFNFWARCKWIYTVPFFDRVKLFEMPLAGFLGFPMLALCGFSTWSWLRTLVRPSRSGIAEKSTLRRAALLSLAALSLVFCWVVYRHALVSTVRSRRPLLPELAALRADDADRLARAGIATPERLERAVAERGASAVALRSGVPLPRVAAAAQQSALALHKGMGVRAAAMLEAVGIPDVATLGRADAEAVWQRIYETTRVSGPALPRPEEVRVWVEAARGRTRPRR